MGRYFRYPSRFFCGHLDEVGCFPLKLANHHALAFLLDVQAIFGGTYPGGEVLVMI